MDSSRTWRIGYNNAYPYHVLGADGRPDGFAFEAIDEAASRKGLRLEWVFVDSGPEDAFRKSKVDLWPRLAAASERKSWHVTEPWMRMSYCLLTPRAKGTRWPVTLKPSRIAHDGTAAIARTANGLLKDATAVAFPTAAAAAEAVCTGAAEAAFFEFRSAQAMLMSRPAACWGTDLLPVPLEGVTVSVGLGAQPYAQEAAEMLRNGLEDLWQDGTLVRLQTKWFYSPPSEVETILEGMAARKMTSFLWFGIAMLVGVLALTLKQVQAARRARRQAELASAAKSELVANISHEIRTPMNGVMGMAALLADSPLSGQQKEMLETIQSSATSLLAVLNDILDFSKIEAGRFTIETADLDLRATAEGVVALLRGAAAAKGISLELRWDPHVPLYVRGDQTRVRQVLLNLAGNAVKFTQQGHVLIDVTREAEIEGGAMVRFSVIDSGIGIAPETLGKLFRPYAQADSTMTRKYGGTGLGLAISKQLVRLMGGEIGVRSEAGKGSTFWFTLPLAFAENPLVGRMDELPAVAPPAIHGHILLVEDNPVNAKITTRLLEKFGHSVLTAANGAQACAAFTRDTYDLILMDVMMPEMDGLEATAEIRTLERSGGYRTPIVALTASAMESDRRRCEAAGMDDYLTKPLSPNLLAEKVQYWLAVSRAANPHRSPAHDSSAAEQDRAGGAQRETAGKAARMHS